MSKSNLTYEIQKKIFKNENSKIAYKECMKWLAVNVFGKEEISKNISVQITKDQKAKIPTFTVTLFVNTDEVECKDRFCMKCKNLYASFFQIEKMNCEECKLKAYHKNNKQYMESMIEIYKKIFEGAEQ